MLSPARKHMMRIKAEQEATAAAESGIRPDASQYELMLAQLYEHKQQLKAIQSIVSKCARKEELLPEYRPYIEGVIAADSGAADDVFMTTMLWTIDAGHYGQALEMATYAIRHGLTMPDQFQRSTACVIAEEIADAALKSSLPLATLLATEQLTAAQDMPDQVRAKLHKALGLDEALQAQQPETALNHLRTALSLDERAGVEKPIEKLERQLKNLAAEFPDSAA